MQYVARLKMDLDIANKRLEMSDEEKRKLTQERDEVRIACIQLTVNFALCYYEVCFFL